MTAAPAPRHRPARADVRILEGDALAVLKSLPSESVQVCVTSPPYLGLRDYGVDGQIGLEGTPSEFITALLAVFDEVHRVLRSDGLCFVNLGDSFAGSGKGPTGKNGIGDQGKRQGFTDVKTGGGLPPKNLLLTPYRFGLAMQGFSTVRGSELAQMADDLAWAREHENWEFVASVESQLRAWSRWSRLFEPWVVRSLVAWCKTSAMPESVRDRPTSAWEPIWMFAKSAKYFFDQDAVRTPATMAPQRRLVPHTVGRGPAQQNGSAPVRTESMQDAPEAGANLRNVWVLGPEPSRLSHFAAYPTELVRRCIKAGTSERGCCAACGSPWVRDTERTAIAMRPNSSSRRGQSASTRQMAGRDTVSGMQRGSMATDVRTLDWAPSCTCGTNETRPCVVLDPFAGSFTTLLVANQLGRSGIGIDLNPDYCRMGEKRIRESAPMLTADSVTVEAPAQLALLEEAAS